MPPKTAASGRGRSQHTRNSSITSQRDKDEGEPFHPAADAATFRDLLIFEERLKQNAARLQARKRKYELLLAGFVGFILCLSHFVVVSPRSSVFLQYSLAAVLMICLTTLFLFFASGMHAERIRSANKFVPQANRSLRSFNMYLNTRTSASSRWWSLRRLLRPDQTTKATSKESSSLVSMVDKALNRGTTVSKSSSRLSSGASSPRRAALSSIPPSQNSRGELIFSNRVSPDFREGYERYRAAFERRRAEKIAAKRAQSWKRWFDYLLARNSTQPANDSTPKRTQARSSRPSAAHSHPTRSSKHRTPRSGQSTTQPDSGSEMAAASDDAPPLHSAGAHGEDLSEGGLSDDGYPPSMASGSSLSGHEPT